MPGGHDTERVRAASAWQSRWVYAGHDGLGGDLAIDHPQQEQLVGSLADSRDDAAVSIGRSSWCGMAGYAMALLPWASPSCRRADTCLCCDRPSTWRWRRRDDARTRIDVAARRSVG